VGFGANQSWISPPFKGFDGIGARLDLKGMG